MKTKKVISKPAKTTRELTDELAELRADLKNACVRHELATTSSINRLEAHDDELGALRGETATLHGAIKQLTTNHLSMFLNHAASLADLERPKPSFWRRLWTHNA